MITEALITISGSVSQGFIYPSLAEIFHRLVPLVLFLGLTHALVIFPAISALFLRLVDSFDPENGRNKTKRYRWKYEIAIYISSDLNALEFQSLASAADFPEQRPRTSFGIYLSKERV